MSESWPKLVVFDLDFTLWDSGGVWCDCLQPPFKVAGGRVVDATGAHIKIYSDTLEIVQSLPAKGCQLALASRTGRPEWARELLDLLQLTETFPFQAIYPSNKQEHFRQLHEESGIPYEEMLFFDDELRNIQSVGKLGVLCFHVTQGVRHADLEEALTLWRGRCE